MVFEIDLGELFSVAEWEEKIWKDVNRGGWPSRSTKGTGEHLVFAIPNGWWCDEKLVR